MNKTSVGADLGQRVPITNCEDRGPKAEDEMQHHMKGNSEDGPAMRRLVGPLTGMAGILSGQYAVCHRGYVSFILQSSF